MFESLDYRKSEDAQRIEQVFKILEEKYQDYQDPWGFDLQTCKDALLYLWPIYRKYFKVRVFGQENLDEKSYMVVSNHTGQVPIDGILVTMAFIFDVDHPRVLRGMVERFLAGLPFLGSITAKTGSILGDRANALYLLENNESLLVFPEGVRGISKDTSNYYKLQGFSKGFFRIALQAQKDILPVAVVGAEEMFPFVFQAKSLAKFLHTPSLPLSTNYFPLPSPIDIYIGKPYPIPDDISSEASDKEINQHIISIENRIRRMIALGLKNRRQFFDGIRKPISEFFRNKHKVGDHE